MRKSILAGRVAKEGRRREVPSRWAGLLLLLAASVIAVAVVVAPIPDFEDLEPRTGTLVAAERERFSPCRSGDCTRTMVTVRHGAIVERYHFGDTDPARFRSGAPITVWTYPELRGLDRVRVWHAEHEGRVLREYGPLAAGDRRIRFWLVLLIPLLAGGGAWMFRRYDWAGRRVN